MVGTTLADRYTLSDRLATGGMGTVFVALDNRLERNVALKLLKEDLAADPRFVERFRREARAAGALSHPNIASVFDYGEDHAHHFIVMELVEGRDLGRVLREEGPLSEDRATRIAAQIADALEHSHAAGLIHRDIKPENVIVGSGDRVKVTDFGIARAQAETSLTATGSFLGTAQYISPEQASGAEVTPASDIYSLGIVLFEMLTGTVPFTGDSAVAVAMRHINDRVPAPSSMRSEVSPTMDAVVEKATASQPEARYATASAFAGAVRGRVTGTTTAPVAGTTQVMDGAPSSTAVLEGGKATTAAEDWPFPAHPPTWDPRRVGRVVVIVFIALLVVAAALLLYRLNENADRQAAGSGGNQQPAAAEPETEAAASEPLPELSGLTYEEAASELEEMGLVVDRSDAPNEEYEEGVVFATDPPSGAEVEEGQTVTLFVSTGPSDEKPKKEDEELLPGEDEFVPPGQEKKEEKDGDD